MPDLPPPKRPHTSRQRYRRFVDDYRNRRLDQLTDAERFGRTDAGRDKERKSKRREFVREYLHWLRPHRYRVALVFLLAATGAAIQLVEPLFMRHIIDRILLNPELDASARLTRLNLVGGSFLALVFASNLLGAFKDFRQRLLNIRVMLSLRRALFDRLLHLPLARLWDMKTGGILSRLTGDIDTTTGLLQSAVISPF